ncbi:MAG: FAD/NAD(P)-binding protein [Pseudomonadota bacterium]
MVASKTHIIVGDGITALAFLANHPVTPGQEFLVIGRAASKLGCGVAYAAGERDVPWRYAYLLNSPADDIDPAFAAWLDAHWDDIRETMRGRAPNWLEKAEPLVEAGDVYGVNAPREFYGDFIVGAAAKLLEQIRKAGGTVQLVDADVTSLEETEDGIQVTDAQGRSFTGATVDIAPGGPSTMRFDGDDGPFAAPTVFGNEHQIAEHILAGRDARCAASVSKPDSRGQVAVYGLCARGSDPAAADPAASAQAYRAKPERRARYGGELSCGDLA